MDKDSLAYGGFLNAQANKAKACQHLKLVRKLVKDGTTSRLDALRYAASVNP